MQKTSTLAALFMLVAAAGITTMNAQEPVRTIEIHAKRFNFTPSEITLKKGETVELKLISDDVTHALVVPELNISSEVSKGHPVDIKVTPDAAGDFHGQCGRFCGAGHGTMLFTVHVQE